MQERVDNQDRPVNLDKTEARQGVRGTGAIYVLVGGIVLALIA